MAEDKPEAGSPVWLFIVLAVLVIGPAFGLGGVRVEAFEADGNHSCPPTGYCDQWPGEGLLKAWPVIVAVAAVLFAIMLALVMVGAWRRPQ